jgi:hypothetical protein
MCDIPLLPNIPATNFPASLWNREELGRNIHGRNIVFTAATLSPVGKRVAWLARKDAFTSLQGPFEASSASSACVPVWF